MTRWPIVAGLLILGMLGWSKCLDASVVWCMDQHWCTDQQQPDACISDGKRCLLKSSTAMTSFLPGNTVVTCNSDPTAGIIVSYHLTQLAARAFQQILAAKGTNSSWQLASSNCSSFCDFDIRTAVLPQAQVIADNAAAAKSNGSGAFTVRMEGPANLWGGLFHCTTPVWCNIGNIALPSTAVPSSTMAAICPDGFADLPVS